MTLTDAINSMFGKRASSPAQRAVNAGAPDAAENPTDGQKRVGNYRKVHLYLDGFRISIENPKGSVRSGTSPDGTKWSNTLACDYGDIRGTESVDGDPVDIYLSDHPEKGAVFVIDQIDPKTKKFDEHKVMYGFDSIEDAKNTYLACYQKGWGGLGWITPVTKAEFRKWIDSSYRKTKPFHEYQSVNPIVDPIKVNEKAATAEDLEKQAKWGKPVRRPLGFVLSNEPSYAKWAAEHPEEVAEFERAQAARKSSIEKSASAEDDDKDHPIPEGMKKKFPIGKWVVFPHARMTGKVRKIVGYEYGGKRDNGKDYYCCWLESPDIEDGKRGKVIGLAMYGGYGDHLGPVFDSRKDAQKDLDDKETASGYRAKQEALAKGQEKSAQAIDDDIDESVIVRFDDDKHNKHGYVRAYDGELSLTNNKDEALVFQHDEIAQTKIEVYCADGGYEPECFEIISVDPRADEPYEDLEKSAQDANTYDYVLEKDGYVSGGTAKKDFDAIIAAFKDRYGMDLSHMRMKWSKHPRYVNGKRSYDFADDETIGSHAGDSTIYINPNLRAVMDRLNIGGKVRDLRRWAIAHELAHELQAAYSNAYSPEFVKKMVSEAKANKFRNGYTDSVPKDKFDKELFAEYMAKLLTAQDSPGAEKSAQVARPSSYTVVGGDALSAIAKRYGTTVAELVRVNKLKDANKIFVGQKLRLPPPPPPPQAATSAGRLNHLADILHTRLNNPALEAAILANLDRETGGRFDYTTKEVGGSGYGLPQYTGSSLKAYNKWLDDNNKADYADTQMEYFTDVYMPSRSGYGTYMANGSNFTDKEYADWIYKKVLTPASTIKGNPGYSEDKIKEDTTRHEDFMANKLRSEGGVWRWNDGTATAVKTPGVVKTSQANDADGIPQGVKLRSFIDAPATRTAIMDNVLEAVKNRFPIEDDDVRLELRDVKYEGPTSYSLKQQKQALLGNRRLGCSIAGTWRLTDKRTGQVLDERRDGIIRVPYYTDRGTIINNGNEYTVISQARLSPGVYVRRKQNGELESQFNVANGLGFRIGLDRETGALNMSIGQGHVPLYPVLHALGVSDDDIRKSWGKEVTSVNIGKFDPRALDKVYARYAGRKADMNLSPVEKAEFVKAALAGSGLNPEVVVRTLGLEGVEGVTGQVMLRAAQKLLNINRGAEDPDDRDNPRFSRYYGVEDMMRERIDKDSGRLTKSLLFRAKRDRSLARIARNALAPYLDTFLSGSGLAMPGEEANPLSILVQQSRITRLGEGGISSPDLVTPEARNVQGDYLGYVDFISGPESFGIGIDVRAALGTMKGSDHRLYNKMMDLRTGKTRYVALDDAASHTVAFPGQDPNAPQLYAMRKGVPTMVPRDEVDFMVPGFGNTVSAGINMTPMPTAVQAGRQFYMSKFWEQYLPQKEGEIPLVDSLMDDGKTTYSEFYGRKVGCLTAPFSGIVTKVNDDEIVIKGKDGQMHTASLVDGLPFNRMTSISFKPQVKKGDTVEEGAILANSNFTDAKTGAMNMGRNLKVAVLPAPEGVSSYEDAIVISESAAKKLATSRTYGFEQDTKEGVQVARNRYLAAFPNAYTKDQADTIDDNGVVKVGTVLHRDDPMILAIGPKMLSAEDAQLGKLSSVLRNSLTDRSQKWEHDWPGVVTDVVANSNGVKVLVKSEPPVKVGDKLSPEFGLKGVVGGVLEDDKMPRDATTNEPYDMLMNPMGFLSRVAPGQIMLMNLAKVAKKTGKQIRIPQIPPPEGWQPWVERMMTENGISETADVFDPQTGRTIKGVGDGYVYTKAFHHLAEKKFSARGVDGAYTMDEQPAKGGVEGSKRISGFDNLALLSHGANEVIKDSMITRGQMNDEYWRRYRLGLPIKEPGVPFIYQKFLNTLRAGGVNVVEKGDVTSIMPQTDADIDELAQGRVIDSSQMVDADFQPVKGGLFDLGHTGGMGGNRWSMIVLPESVPNPIMEEPIRRILGLTMKDMEAVLSGKKDIDGKTGGDAIKAALSKVNIDDAMERARAEIQNRRGSQRDNAIKVLGYLKSAKEMGMKPENWMISRVPVLPPMFRPVAKMGDVALVPDMNELYKELIEMKHNYEDLSKELPASALASERLAMYGAVKAAYGLGDSITAEGQAKNLKGAIRQVIGTIPKFGMYQSKVVSKTQDNVGRGVTIPDKNLDMDQIGLPEDMAWEMYKPHVERKLILRGYSPVAAKQMIEERNATASHLLEDVMEERPVLMDRAPTWHKFNIMAFKPHIVKGHSIHICPLIDSGYNMDHDGDTVNIHVPASDKAAKQAMEKMLPSKNLFSLTDMKSMRYKPEKEQISGLWALTRGRTRKPVRYFSSKAEAVAAYRNGEIGPNDPIEIKGV